MVNNPNWQEADQMAANWKCGRGVELGATEKQLPLARIHEFWILALQNLELPKSKIQDFDLPKPGI